MSQILHVVIFPATSMRELRERHSFLGATQVVMTQQSGVLRSIPSGCIHAILA